MVDVLPYWLDVDEEEDWLHYVDVLPYWLDVDEEEDWLDVDEEED